MNNIIDLSLRQQQHSLNVWLKECKRRINMKYPEIEFESDHWPINKLYKTDQVDLHFKSVFDRFKSKDRSFCDAIRCMAAEMFISGAPIHIRHSLRAFCLLTRVDTTNIFEITLDDLRKVENHCLITAVKNEKKAMTFHCQLLLLSRQIELLAGRGVIPWFGYRPSKKVLATLFNIGKSHKKRRKAAISAILDHKIEAFNDALNCLYDNDPRLSPADRVTIAVLTCLMCAPSRINEILCLSINDHVTIEDYAQKSSIEDLDGMHRVHQMLLITMKGSKGASWCAKPALNFMIDAFNFAIEVIKQQGQRSRMLVEWYQQNPNTLYLTPELEHLRGRDLNSHDLAKIIYMTENPSQSAIRSIGGYRVSLLKDCPIVPFKNAEQFLLQKVHLAMEACRRVTGHNHYQGDLSKMLVLCDLERVPYLPWAVSYFFILRRLGNHPRCSTLNLFKKLGITMPVDGKVADAWIESHDPRRWLTTQALRHGENLSDVLINKWANRLKLAQLKSYDLRSDKEVASFSAMPAIAELEDLSRGIVRVCRIEEEFGLKTAIVSVPDADISVTSMDSVLQAVEDRPIARTSEQIIILYPSQYGICLHPHYQMPCRNYDSCLPCTSNVIVKGHLPSNDKIRNRAESLFKSIIRQLERLIIEQNRGIADDPRSFAQHILMLVAKGLDCKQMTKHLIDEFQQIKDTVEDKLLRKRIEEAFVARGFVNLLDDIDIPKGAMIKYHNPAYHASPSLERACNAHGGRAEIQRSEQALIRKYPQFAPQALGLKDERHLLEMGDDDSEEE